MGFPHLLYILLEMGYTDIQARQMVSAQHELVARSIGCLPYLIVDGALPRCNLPSHERAAAEQVCTEILESYVDQYGESNGPMGTRHPHIPQGRPQTELNTGPTVAGPSRPGGARERYDPEEMERYLRDNPIDLAEASIWARQATARLWARRRAAHEQNHGNIPPSFGDRDGGFGRSL
jgi:hypothetical protein